MIYCLNYNISKEYMDYADQLRVDFDKPNTIESLFLDYPDKDIVVMVKPGDMFNLTEAMITNWNTLSKGHLILCLPDLAWAHWLNENGIRFYYGFSLTSFSQLYAVKDAGVCAVKIDAPLFFNLKKIKELVGLPIIVAPNMAFDDGLMRKETFNGKWIRPEDITIYEDYIDIIEFDGVHGGPEEEALYRLYAKEHKWPANLNLIIKDLVEEDVDNACIDSIMVKCRLNCGQKCTCGSPCRLCQHLFSLANREALEAYNEVRYKIKK